MTDLIVRIFEISLGSLLIVATLILSNYFVNDIILLLPLLALPIIFSGIFDWHPARKLGLLTAKFGDAIKQPLVEKTSASSL